MLDSYCKLAKVFLAKTLKWLICQSFSYPARILHYIIGRKYTKINFCLEDSMNENVLLVKFQ